MTVSCLSQLNYLFSESEITLKI